MLLFNHGTKSLVQAMCMDPGDSSAWSYHRWLLEGVMENARRVCGKAGEVEALTAAKSQLDKEAALCDELVELVRDESGGSLLIGDPAAKWPLLALAGIKRLQAELFASVRSSYSSVLLF